MPRCLIVLLSVLILSFALPTPAPALDGVTVTFAVIQDWTSGFEANVTLRNTSGSTLRDWRLTFRLAGTINSIWNGQRLADQDGAVVVAPASWNSDIAPGGSVTVGFTASPGGTAPTDVAVSGAWCDACAVIPPPVLPGTADYRITADRDADTFVLGQSDPLQIHVRTGQSRTFAFDRAITGVVSRNPAAAAVTIADGRLTAQGLVPGRTGLALTFADGTRCFMGLRIDAAGGSLPGLPGPVAVGSVSEDSDADLAFWRNHVAGPKGTRADIRYIYINGGPIAGWKSWDPDRAVSFAKESLALGLVPFFVFYNIPDGGESYTTDLEHVQNADYMAAYYSNLTTFLSETTAVMQGELYGVILEPDFLGYLQQNSGLPPSAIATADGTVPDTVQRINAAIRGNGGNVLFGWQLNLWASPTATGGKGVIRRTDDDDQGWTAGRATIVAAAREIAAYAMAAGILSSQADFVSIDKYGLDAGISSPADPAKSTWFWNSDHWNNYLLFAQTLGEAAGRPMVLWQLPVGHINGSTRISARTGAAFATLANTSQHYEDSTATFFFGDTLTEPSSLRAAYFAQNRAADAGLSANGQSVVWSEHIGILPSHGIIAALFGAGVGDSTDGLGQPPTDDWFWIQALQDYYLAHPVVVQTTTALPAVSLLLGQ
ncbi:cellulose binding domain-containing protein [Desulfovibrio sp. TomC]|uniref:cellulose binding domain-containing protein n=1 Tax=Desulfovibrio sp. TomC TaxID=1562888 RepID=UPI000573A9EB|nr:cellulose binding domain-containing protein [Desulfovibrio sp. TomC]KHK01547.1 secreted cellulase [Desulfovibrio sp. TomC]